MMLACFVSPAHNQINILTLEGIFAYVYVDPRAYFAQIIFNWGDNPSSLKLGGIIVMI